MIELRESKLRSIIAEEMRRLQEMEEIPSNDRVLKKSRDLDKTFGEVYISILESLAESFGVEPPAGADFFEHNDRFATFRGSMNEKMEMMHPEPGNRFVDKPAIDVVLEATGLQQKLQKHYQQVETVPEFRRAVSRLAEEYFSLDQKLRQRGNLPDVGEYGILDRADFEKLVEDDLDFINRNVFRGSYFDEFVEKLKRRFGGEYEIRQDKYKDTIYEIIDSESGAYIRASFEGDHIRLTGDFKKPKQDQIANRIIDAFGAKYDFRKNQFG